MLSIYSLKHLNSEYIRCLSNESITYFSLFLIRLTSAKVLVGPSILIHPRSPWIVEVIGASQSLAPIQIAFKESYSKTTIPEVSIPRSMLAK